MAVAYKVLGQSAPSATTLTDVYTVPASTQAIISTIVVSERGGSAGTFRIAVRPNGAAAANQHYIAYDSPIAANDIVGLSIGVTVDSADVISVYCSSANMSVNIFGSEVS